jgi:hypothetical protein
MLDTPTVAMLVDFLRHQLDASARLARDGHFGRTASVAIDRERAHFEKFLNLVGVDLDLRRTEGRTLFGNSVEETLRLFEEKGGAALAPLSSSAAGEPSPNAIERSAAVLTRCLAALPRSEVRAFLDRHHGSDGEIPVDGLWKSYLERRMVTQPREALDEGIVDSLASDGLLDARSLVKTLREELNRLASDDVRALVAHPLVSAAFERLGLTRPPSEGSLHEWLRAARAQVQPGWKEPDHLRLTKSLSAVR